MAEWPGFVQLAHWVWENSRGAAPALELAPLPPSRGVPQAAAAAWPPPHQGRTGCCCC